MDVLILGGYYGEGKRRAGGVSSVLTTTLLLFALLPFIASCTEPALRHFLLGLAEPNPNGGYPADFYAFCKVRTLCVVWLPGALFCGC